MSGYGAGYGDAGVTGYEDPNAVAGYGQATGEARLVYISFLMGDHLQAVSCMCIIRAKVIAGLE